MKKQLAAVGLAAGLAAGGAAGFAFAGSTGLAGAERVATPTTVAPTGSSSTSGSTEADAGRPDRRERLREALQGLVDDKTISEAQADKVVEALTAAAPMGDGHGGPGGMGRHGGPGGMGRHGGPGARGGLGLDVAAKALGVTVDELRTSLRAGTSIAEVAKDKGVDLDKVIAAMVDEATTRLDSEVEAGRITQAEADERASTIKERITAHVNGERPAGRPGRGNGPGHGPDDSATTPTTTTK